MVVSGLKVHVGLVDEEDRVPELAAFERVHQGIFNFVGLSSKIAGTEDIQWDA